MRRTLYAFPLVLLACDGAKDPVYLRPTPPAIESDPDTMIAGQVATVQLSVRPEDENEAIERMALAMDLGLTPEQVPQVRRDDYDVEIEWTIKNLSDRPGTAIVSVVGANEYFLYDPSLFVIDPDEDEPPPPLLGGVPITVAPSAVVSGHFTEEQVAEAAQDWDAISRAGVVAQRALLERWDGPDLTMEALVAASAMGGELMAIPSAAIPAIIQYDISFESDTHMVLEYVLRVREHDDRLIPYPDADTALVPASTTAFQPVLPMP